MRNFLTLLISLFTIIELYSQNIQQENIEKLNDDEVQLLDSLLKDERKDFDFRDEKIAFISGSTDTVIIGKNEAFENILPWTSQNSRPSITVVRLNDTEKKDSGGYDALVLIWVKVFTENGKKRTIKKLGSEDGFEK